MHAGVESSFLQNLLGRGGVAKSLSGASVELTSW